MKRFSRYAISIALLFTLAACSSVKTTITSTVYKTTTPILTLTQLSPIPSATIAPSPSPVPSATIAPSPSPISQNTLTWEDGIKPVIIVNPLQQLLWSPTSNEVLYMNCHDGRSDIIKASEPEFLPETLATTNDCRLENYFPDITWSPNGQYIFYWGSSGQQSNDIWMMKNDGGDQQPLSINDNWRIPMFATWLDPNTLLYENYTGGGHSIFSAINIATSEKNEIALAPGEVNKPNNGYVPITYEPFPGEYHLLVISKKLPTSHEALYTFYSEGHYSPLPEFSSTPIDQTISSFKGWQPNTNQMLVQWKGYSATLSMPDSILQKQHLLLWNVTNNSLSLFAPNSFDGGFSSDDHYFAYSTIGQAKLNNNGMPVDFENNYHPNLYEDPNTYSAKFTTFIQLLDMENLKVIMSIPGLYKSFSADGHYLIFTTNGKVEIDDTSWPIGIVQKTEQDSFLNILDLRSKQLVNSLSDVSKFLSWSPDNNKFLYQDLSGNIHAYNIEKISSSAITQSMDKLEVEQLNWSRDGQYFILIIVNPQQYEDSSIVIIKTP